MKTEQYETGATSHAVNDLILFTDNTRNLAELRDYIFESTAREDEMIINHSQYLYYQLINLLLYKAMNQYLDEFPGKEDHKHIAEMTVAQQEEYVQLYIREFTDFKK